ncbi:5-hydroxytryptamine receptor 2A-like [Musca domestica]|uniref:5-hydroxytryptamine receptor 2A-like n=1 Tax=Musca domestica TaxID=7370 RepID=A0ABM3UT10_MUSDO|nr:5-hydroxytryptamine receptor 2A-like [Musca domestica]
MSFIPVTPDLMAQKKRKRLRLRFGKFTNVKTNMAMGRTTTLGLVEGNSTNTVNTVEVEDTEFSSSNVDSKSRAGIEVTNAAGSHITAAAAASATHIHSHSHAVVATSSAPVAATANTNTNLNNTEEIATESSSSTQIATVSHLVALANQQRNASAKTQQQQQTSSSLSASSKCLTQPVTVVENPLEPLKTTASTPTDAVNVATVSANGMSSTVVHNNSHHQQVHATEVLADPQLQQQLEQVQQQTQNEVPTSVQATVAAAIQSAGTATTAAATTTATSATTANKTMVGGGGGAGTSASNATTITSISALSPQTPNAATPSGPVAPHTSHTTPASVSASSQQVTPIPRPKNPQQQLSSIANPMHKVTKRKETLEAKRERKAAKTLAIITGAFVVCWLPFFVMALLLPLCEACEINDGIASLFLWLGYFNSTLNPVIYTIFSPEFRQAFKRILFGGHRPVHYRSGKL